MADELDFTKKILVDVELKSDQLKKDLPALIGEIDRLTTSQAALKKAGKIATDQFVEQAEDLRSLKSELRDTNKYIDNTTKAIYSQTNSIQQNRAILSLMTGEYIRLEQVEGKTAESTLRMAVNIKNLTELLKAQEAQIGQTYRNVGNYTESINKANIALGQGSGLKQVAGFAGFLKDSIGALPQAFTSMAGAAVPAFTAMSSSVIGFNTVMQTNNELQAAAIVAANKSAIAEQTLAVAVEEAAVAEKLAADGTLSNKEAQIAQTAVTEAQTAATEAKTEAEVASKAASSALSIETIGLIASIVGVIAVFGAVITWFAKLTPNAEALQRGISGLGSAYDAFMSDIGKGVGFGQLFDDMSQAYNQAKLLTGAMQDLAREAEIVAVANADADEKIADLQLKMRNRRNTPEQEQNYFNQIQNISNQSYEQRKALAQKEYDLAVGQATTGRKFTDEMIADIKRLGVARAAEVDKELGLANKGGAGTDVKAIAKAQEDLIAAERFKETIQDKAQNRLDQQQLKQEQRDKTAADKAQRLLEQQTAALTEAENIRKASANKVLQDIYEDYGDRAVAAEQNYNNELTKLKKFYDKKLINQAVFNSVNAQLTAEHEANVAKIIQDFRLQDQEKFTQAQNELINLRNQAILNDTARTIAGIKQKSVEENQALNLSNQEHIKNQRALEVEIKALTGAAQAEAIERRENELVLIQANETKRIEIAKATARSIADAKRKETQDIITAGDEASVLQAKRNTNLFTDDPAKNAELLQTTHKYDFEISEAARAGKSTVALEQQKIDAIKAINDKYRNEKIEFSAQTEQQIQSAAFGIISQGIQQSSQAELNVLSKQKNAELANSSLTATQKTLINDKYQKQEDNVKRKAFRDNQKLQAANALLNGAVAVTKTIAEMGFLPAIPFVAATVALTAASVAKILSAKPGFATGGVYRSDGRGAMLSGYSRHDDTNARLRSGEAVVVSEAMRVPWARNQVSRINEMFGGRSFSVPGSKPAFATGGVFTDGGNSNRYFSQPVYDSQGLANSLAYQLINNFPPIFTDVKDVNREQGILAKTTNRVDL